MSQAQQAKRDAVIYLPGLFGSGDISVDAIAKRIAVAFDRNQQDGKARFGISDGNEFEFEGQARTRQLTIQRTDPGKAPQSFIDIYAFDYRDTLKAKYIDRSPARQAMSILWLLITFFPRYLYSLFMPGKTLGEKLQVTLAGFMILLLVIYLFMLLYASAATLASSMDAIPAQQPMTGWSDFKALLNNLPGSFGFLHYIQSVVIVLTGLGLFFKQGLRQVIADVAINFAAGLDYLAADHQKTSIVGHFAGLLETIAESDIEYERIHVIGYSFGSIVAIDCIFQTSAPTPRFSRIDHLITVGSPGDIVRTFWPHYFDQRKLPSTRIKWVNVFSRNDILSSNFADRAGRAAQEPDFNIGEGEKTLKPTNVHYDGSFAHSMNLFERMNRARKLHAEYWGESDHARTFLYQQVPQIWSGHAALQ